MERAVELAGQSVPELDRDPSKPPPPQVGAVIVRDGELLGEGHRGQHGDGDHAEYGVIREITEAGGSIKGATLYTTLEPCSRRPTKTPCAQHLVAGEIGEVFIGVYDPNPEVYSQGWRLLRDAGVKLRDFDADLRAKLLADNHAFLDSFRYGHGSTGDVSFDPLQNDRSFVV
jgi:diaminohydroxyphosphoribosylaminopyrimidine deaminase/5-amino-6-(5-phosphoribosylamino)uracil reductase